MKTPEQRASQKEERRIAAAHGGKAVKASGATWAHKGDVKFPDILLEHKLTGKKQISIKSEWLKKIYREAMLDLKTAVLQIHLDGEDYVVLRADDFWALRDGQL